MKLIIQVDVEMPAVPATLPIAFNVGPVLAQAAGLENDSEVCVKLVSIYRENEPTVRQVVSEDC